jgi:hypothetical protein
VNPAVKIVATKKIKEYIDSKHPFSIVNAENQLMTLFLNKVK